MDRALYIAMTGAAQNMLSQRAHANNLANVNTTAFKADWEQARAMPVFGETFPSRVYAMSERPATNFEQGTLIETGRELDVAIAGPGWIAVQDAEGQEAYTRAGELQMDATGLLMTGSGQPVLGEGGPIVIPPASKIEIGQDGTVSIVPLGQGPETLAQVDRIKLVNPPLDTLEKGKDGLVRQKGDAAGQPLPPDGTVRLEPGFVEASNVSAVEEMTSILTLARQYEMQVKVMQAADQAEEASARILQNS
ncbi:flagellar basal-body rod protein FlgF [Hahella sp. SMD15-11]|uniref:Flagellar basal-body rod protein FlgF n=1 Tax=Thermohahella caldifontis TaxID=3142973 RepID=A0AB39UY52_9GAMM